MGSRGVYHDGWMGSVFGPRIPWLFGGGPGLVNWNPDKDVWSIYNLTDDYSQSTDLAARMPDKAQELKDWFSIEAATNKVFPVGGGLFIPLNPSMMKASTQTEWLFPAGMVRTPRDRRAKSKIAKQHYYRGRGFPCQCERRSLCCRRHVWRTDFVRGVVRQNISRDQIGTFLSREGRRPASLGKIKTEHAEFPMDPRCSPSWVLGNHLKNQFPNLLRRLFPSNLPPDSGN
jgi:hypothetical protein